MPRRARKPKPSNVAEEGSGMIVNDPVDKMDGPVSAAPVTVQLAVSLMAFFHCSSVASVKSWVLKNAPVASAAPALLIRMAVPLDSRSPGVIFPVLEVVEFAQLVAVLMTARWFWLEVAKSGFDPDVVPFISGRED